MPGYDWIEFVVFADALRQGHQINVSQETLDRIAVSRAYYGILGAARRCLVDRGDPSFRSDGSEKLRDRGKKIHDYVIDSFRKLQTKDETELGECLGDLRDLRNEADYDSRLNHLSEKDIRIFWETAARAMDLLNNIQASST